MVRRWEVSQIDRVPAHPLACVPLTPQDLAKLISESRVAQRVNEGVESGADVADPGHCEDLLLTDHLRLDRNHHEDDEVRHKTDGEDTHDHPELEGGEDRNSFFILCTACRGVRLIWKRGGRIQPIYRLSSI